MRIRIQRRIYWNHIVLLLAAIVIGMPPAASADICQNDDVIIDGSLNIGIDSVCNRSFGFDTLVLSENNLRVLFEDTSNSASFPTNDWRITINDSSNGGGNYFSIDDVTGNRKPFRTDAGAPTNSLRVDSQGDVGLGVAAPAVELHIADGDTPTVRLEQNGTSGFTPQTWDLAGNETNFFIRDVTNGSKLPFRIRTNSPTSSIDVFSDKIQIGTSAQKVGIGTASPDNSLDVEANIPAIRLTDADGIGTAAAQGFLEAYDSAGANRLWIIGDRSPGGDALFLTADTGELQFSAGTTTVQMKLKTSGALALLPTGNPGADVTFGQLFIDTADGDLKMRFPNGMTKLIVTDN